MTIKPLAAATSLALAALLSTNTTSASTITGWNLANVEVSAATGEGESVIYDRNVTGGTGTAGATTSGKVIFDGVEAISPGLLVDNTAFMAGGVSFGGCIGANGGTQVGSDGCGGVFQSGKRFKNVLTGTGPVDFVFSTDPTADDPAGPYRLFHRLINDTGDDLVDLIVSLGTGVGGAFQQSVAGDGLRFSASAEFGGANLPATSQFPFGLFGDADTNPNFTLDGFFADARSGFTIPAFADGVETDSFSTSGLFGPYGDLFGPWMTLADAPAGAFWDFDNNPDTDDLLIAWLNGDGLWEQRRGFDGSGDTGVENIIPIDPVTYGDLNLLINDFGRDLGDGVIEDLANLNLNYAIDVAGFAGDSFTLRVQASAVPAPAGAALLLGGLAILTLVRRRSPA
jgi:hypothetical protein